MDKLRSRVRRALMEYSSQAEEKPKQQWGLWLLMKGVWSMLGVFNSKDEALEKLRTHGDGIEYDDYDVRPYEED